MKSESDIEAIYRKAEAKELKGKLPASVNKAYFYGFMDALILVMDKLPIDTMPDNLKKILED